MSNAAEELDALMEAEKQAGHFSTAKGTLRFYLRERKKIVDAAREIDWITAQGTWYEVEPYVPLNGKGEYIDRDVFVSYIRDICKNDLHCRREDLKIVAGGRADLYFDGEWTSISWDNIEELSESGTDGIMIEKDGMSRIFTPFVDNYGFAVINTRGFFVDYLDYVSEKAIEKKSNFVLIRDLDPSGLIIEWVAKQLGIPCIGVNDEMLQFLGLTRKDVQNVHPPSNKNTHWKKLRKLAETDPEIQKEIPYLSKYRIEIDKVHVKAGSKRLFEYVLYKLKEYHRDLNRVAYPNAWVQPASLGRLAYEIHRVGKKPGLEEAREIYGEQYDYDGLCDDIPARRKWNDDRVRRKIESNEHIRQVSKELKPIIKRLQEVKTETDDEGDTESEEERGDNEE